MHLYKNQEICVQNNRQLIKARTIVKMHLEGSYSIQRGIKISRSLICSC